MNAQHDALGVQYFLLAGKLAKERAEIAIWIVSPTGVLVIQDGKDNLSESTVELRLAEDLIKHRSNVSWRIAECSTPKRGEHQGIMSMEQ